MDRSILEGDPYCLIEGMMIAGYAIGAQFGYVYVRAEYPLAIQRLQKPSIPVMKKAISAMTAWDSVLSITCGLKWVLVPLSAVKRLH